MLMPYLIIEECDPLSEKQCYSPLEKDCILQDFLERCAYNGTLDEGRGGGIMSHVKFKKCLRPLTLEWPCPMSPLRCSHVACRS